LIPFNLKNIDGKFYSEKFLEDKNITIIAFICNHCPYVIAVIERLVNIQNKYRKNGVQIVAINSNDSDQYPEDSFDNMIKFAEQYNFTFPYLYDEDQKVASEYEAVCTPDIYVYDKNKKLRYRGRIDDNWKDENSVRDNWKDENSVREKDLEKAINQILNDEEINFEQIPSMGCSIKWKK